jgi:hypothetical protein
MKSKLFAVAIALSSTLASAETRTGGDYSIDWSSTLNQAVPIIYTEETFRAFWSDTAQTGSFSLLATYDDSDRVGVTPSATARFAIKTPDDAQLRFSYWHLVSTLEMRDETTGTVIGSATYDHYGTSSENPSISAWTYTIPHVEKLRITGSYIFSPGNVLTPSFDSSCQSFDCMPLQSDAIQVLLGAVVTTAPVPEPSALLMLLLGIGAVGFATRRRNVQHDNVIAHGEIGNQAIPNADLIAASS